mgnify:CR=1 FL=1
MIGNATNNAEIPNNAGIPPEAGIKNQEIDRNTSELITSAKAGTEESNNNADTTSILGQIYNSGANEVCLRSTCCVIGSATTALTAAGCASVVASSLAFCYPGLTEPLFVSTLAQSAFGVNGTLPAIGTMCGAGLAACFIGLPSTGFACTIACVPPEFVQR